MVDPVKMSGMPLPDAQLPAGTISVRVLKGGFQTSLAGQVVTLDGPGGPRRATSGSDGRTRFDGLQVGGTYVAHTTGLGRTLDSQPMTLEAGGGVKVMLVHPLDEKELLGEADGKARHDDRLPRGTIEVRVYNEEATPQKGIKVVLGRAAAGGKDTPAVEEKTAETDAEGAARFTGLVPADDVAYAVKVLRPGAEAVSEPFRLTGDHGMLVAIKSIKVDQDLSRLRIAEGSHFIVEVRDEAVQVVENLVLSNPGQTPIDPGPGGLRLPLADGAQGADLGADPGGAPLRIEGDAVVYGGRIPPGNTNVRFAFLLPIDGESITLRQPMPVAMSDVKVIVERYEGMTVSGPGMSQEERTLPGGRAFWLVSGPPVKAGGQIQLQLAGLPHASPLWRQVAAAVTIVIVLWGLGAALRRPARASRDGGRSSPDRARLERRRQSLLDELVTVDDQLRAAAADADGQKLARRREALVADLARVYHDLDDEAAA